MKRLSLQAGLLFSFFVNGLMAEQSASQGKQAVQEHKAKQQEGRAPLKSYKEKPEGTNPSSKKVNEGAEERNKNRRMHAENKATADRINKNASEYKK